ncbi:MAG: hypothetical protein H7287_06105 [Thermoleophilia bacterium]|nr:hypothetical protein [Thermoleophilia bacterium]
MIIAALVIAIVIGAAAGALQGASRGNTNAKVASRGQAVASSVLHALQANTSWMSSCSGGSVCTVDPKSFMSTDELDVLTKEEPGTITHGLVVTATPADLPNDLTGANDRDAQTIDVYRVRVTDTVAGPAAPVNAVYTVDGTVNPAERGRTGVVRIRACAVEPAVDERMSNGLCAAATGSGTAVATTTGIAAPPVCTAATQSYICTPWNAVPASLTDHGVSVKQSKVRPMNGLRVTLTGPLVGASTARTVVLAASGSIDVPKLDPGTYTIAVGTPSWDGRRWTTWSSHSIPSSGTLIVEKGALREATLMMRVDMAPVTVRLETIIRTNPMAVRVDPWAYYDQTVRLMSIPSGRSILERGTGNNGWTTIRGAVAGGDRSVVLADAYPGIYSPSLLNYPKSYLSPLRTPTNYVYLTTDGTVQPNALVLRQDYCDPVARHVIVTATCGIYRWCFSGSTFIGECNDNPQQTGTSTSGNGAA